MILVAMVVAISAQTGKAAGNSDTVKSMCSSADYKQACEQSLHKLAGADASPNQLVMAGFEAAIVSLRNAIANSSTVKEAANDPMSQKALENCKNLMNTAIDDLRASIKQVGDFDI